MDKLKNIGFSDWFQTRVDADKIKLHEVARIVSVHKESYIITNALEDVFAELSGSLLFNSDSASHLPTVGDWVYADFYDENTHAIIHGVMPRKTLLKRKAVGKLIDFQLIAANIDVAFIIQSANENFNLRRLERYLVMANESEIEPVILLSKSDLIPQSEIDEIMTSIFTIAPDVKVQAFSNTTLENIDSIKDYLISSSTYCLLGSSGVGKTTLLNTLIGESQFETKPVSNVQSKGRHTTTSRELIQLKNGAIIIDTPGMRELGSMSVNTGIDETFSEVLELTYSCKFGDCSHTNEKGCAVLNAIKNGELSDERYKNYVKMKAESAFNDMSFSEKKKKDKDFGKLIKATIKNKSR